MSIYAEINWASIWSEIKEVQTLLAGMFAFFAARYAYMQATRRDRERAEIIKQIAIKRIFYSLGKLSVITEMPSLVVKARNETNTELTKEEIENWKTVITHIKELAKDVSTSIEENRDDLLSLSPKQYKQISMAETYVRSIYDSLDIWIDSAMDEKSFEQMALTVKSQYLKTDEMVSNLIEGRRTKLKKWLKRKLSFKKSVPPPL